MPTFVRLRGCSAECKLGKDEPEEETTANGDKFVAPHICYDRYFKVIVLGRSDVGKSSLSERFLTDRFFGEHFRCATVGTAYGSKPVVAKEFMVTLGVWDTAGAEMFDSITQHYYRNAQAAIVCYSVVDKSSWDKLNYWVNQVETNAPDCKIYLCATKLDLINGNNKLRKVDYHDTLDYAELKNCPIFETSSKDNHNVAELFNKIAIDFVEDSSQDLSDYDEVIRIKAEKKIKRCSKNLLGLAYC